MSDIAEGDVVEVPGSGAKPHRLKNVGGVYSCSCPAWRNQSLPIDRRTCKHLKGYRGADVEAARCGAPVTATTQPQPAKDVPPLLLAVPWDGHEDVAGWWVSEKLDGVRALWDGTKFVSRLGNTYMAPDWYRSEMPAETLDGELWLGHKRFQETVSVVRQQDAGNAWGDVQFVCFDAPDHPGPFEERLAHAVAVVGSKKYVRVLEQTACGGADDVREKLAQFEALGAEGLMLRRPGTDYRAGRSGDLLKVKSFLDDEAVVVGYTAGKGRHKGRCGALEVQWRHGTFSVGTGLSDAERAQPPAVGTTVTFRYQELSNDNVPRFPTYVGVRVD